MNSSWDGPALEAYEAAMPGYIIEPFTGSWQSTDALHCRVKGIPDITLLTPPQFDLGDANLDGIINVLDIVIVVNYVLGVNEFNNSQFQASDMNSDGTVNILDIISIVNIIIGQ